jgi:hypothetical protein
MSQPKKPDRLELSKKRTQKYMQVSVARWVEVFSENQRLKTELEKLKPSYRPPTI